MIYAVVTSYSGSNGMSILEPCLFPAVALLVSLYALKRWRNDSKTVERVKYGTKICLSAACFLFTAVVSHLAEAFFAAYFILTLSFIFLGLKCFKSGLPLTSFIVTGVHFLLFAYFGGLEYFWAYHPDQHAGTENTFSIIFLLLMTLITFALICSLFIHAAYKLHRRHKTGGKPFLSLTDRKGLELKKNMVVAILFVLLFVFSFHFGYHGNDRFFSMQKDMEEFTLYLDTHFFNDKLNLLWLSLGALGICGLSWMVEYYLKIRKK